MIRIKLLDWLKPKGKPRNPREFFAAVFTDTGKDVYTQIFDDENDLIPVVAVQIENDDGKLMLRVWQGDLENDPVINVDLTVNRNELSWCLKCGDDWACHGDAGEGCIQDA
jgi:hypothetical protein